MVDGQWRELKVQNYEISVKGRSEPVSFDVKYTHRGPLMQDTLAI